MNKPFTPTKQQTQAADPNQSVWVTANAGSGKTHVLIERVIRLLLDGAEPSTILCITFTKAAAAEMSSRLYHRLSQWIALDDDALTLELNALGLSNLQPTHFDTARRLFTRVLETPGGLKIQTIHAFCERLLQLFPVEAGIAPGFRVMDDRQTRNLREQAKTDILRQAQQNDDPELTAVFTKVVAEAGTETFDSLVQSFLSSTQNLRNLLETDLDQESFSLLLKNAAEIDLSESIGSAFEKLNTINEIEYKNHAEVLSQFKAYRGHDAASLMKLACSQINRADTLKQIFFTKDDVLIPRQKLMANDVAETHPSILNFILREQSRLTELFHQLDMLKRIDVTAAIFVLSKAIYQRIEKQKRNLGTYDFDDLIKRTSVLLGNSRARQWVLYKLDSGLSHILLDEAQDTSPAQWQIIQALAEEFFAGASRPQKSERTIFVVGDRKQSIYSFQGADAATFAMAREKFTTYVNDKSKSPSEIELTISYRSTDAIIAAVNQVFPAKNPERLGFAPKDMSEQDHTTNRIGAPGKVEVWPLILPPEDQDAKDHWLAPVDLEPSGSPKRQLAQKIAKTIKSWIGQRKLESLNRLIEPGDIMILLQSRGSLSSMLIAELRKSGVAVAGADRLKLRESLAVQDLIALAQWLLLPEDDYAMACILKSPFVPEPLNDTELFELAHGRGTNLIWHKIQDQATTNADWFRELLNTSTHLGPSYLFAKILTKFRKAMARRLGPEAGDATDAFFDLAVAYEAEHGPSLAGFLHWFNAGETEIRRELEKSSGEVRLMTVHGAKGLEANIVFLADAASVPRGRDSTRLLMISSKTYTKLPLWMLSGLSISPLLQKEIDETKLRSVAERNRLLYVAMTRARDELYICGAKGKLKDIPKDSWYATVEPVLGVSLQTDITIGAEPFVQRSSKSKQQVPSWIKDAAPSEAPHEGSTVTQLASTEHLNAEPKGVKRGSAIHNILQALPNIVFEDQINFAKAQARRFGLEESEALALVKLVNVPHLAPFFGSDGESEVEILGLHQSGQNVVGRIDRMVKTETEIVLIDFKSDRFVPESIGLDHPYAQQISLYSDLMQSAFPTHKVKAALLWTQNSKLEWIPTLSRKIS